MSDQYRTGVPVADPNQNRVKETLVLISIFPALATIAIALRFTCRRLSGISLWWDDWTALLALGWAWALMGIAAISVRHGLARHIEVVPDSDQILVLYYFFWFQLTYVVLPPTIKISALLLYKRIFISPKFTFMVKFMIYLILAWTVSSILLAILGCIPVSALWEGGGKCYDFHAWILGFGIPNIILDVIVWGMPIPRVWLLKLPLNQKIILTIIFVIGLTDCVLAIIRLSGSASALGDPDYTYSWSPAYPWCLIHTCLGIVVISLPTMRILLVKCKWLLPTSLGSWRHEEFLDSEDRSNNIANRKANYGRPKMSDAQIVGLSLSGENEQSLHSNTIAMALRSGSMDTAVPESSIMVKNEFTMETNSKQGTDNRSSSGTNSTANSSRV